MNLMTSLTIILLRYKLIKRMLLKKRNLSLFLVFFSMSIFIVYFLCSKGVITAIVSMIFLHNPENLSGVLFLLLLYSHLVIIFFIFTAGANLHNAINYNKISFMPISNKWFYITEILFSFADIWVIVLLPIFISISIGLHIAGSFVNIVLVVNIFVWLVIFIGTFNQFVISIVEFLTGIKILDIVFNIFILIFVMLLLFAPIMLIGNNPELIAKKISHIFYNSYLYLTPIGLTVDGFINIVKSDYRKIILLDLPLIFGYVCLFLFSGYRISKLLVEKRNRINVKTGKTINWYLKIEKLVNIVLKHNAALVSKEIIYLIRSPRIIILFFTAFLFEMLQLMNYFSAQHPDFILLILFLSISSIFWIMDSNYVFSFDSKAVKIYFYSPLTTKQFMLYKNFAFIFIVLLYQIFVYVTAILIFKNISGIAVISSLLLICYVMVINMIILNYIAITNPISINYNSVFCRSRSNMLLALISFIISLVPAAVCLFLFHNSGYKIIACLSVLFLTGVVLYIVNLGKISEILQKNKERFIMRAGG